MTHQAYKRSSKTKGGAGCHAPWLIKNLRVYSTYLRDKEGDGEVEPLPTLNLRTTLQFSPIGTALTAPLSPVLRDPR